MPKITTNLYGELAFLPYQAQRGLTERLEWLTDIMGAQAGVEQRFERRTKPRYSFEYDIPLQYWKKADAQNTLYGGLRDDWGIPLWHEMQEVGNITSGQTLISCDTLYHDLRPQSLALLINCYGIYEVVEIDAITDTSITLTTGANPINNAYLLPVRKGFLVGSGTVQTNGREGSVRLSFKIDDNLSLTVGEPEQYKTNDIYYTPGIIGDTLERSFQKRQDISDFDLGPISRRTPWLNSRVGIPYNKVLEGLQEVREYKEFLYRRAGRYREFWLPTFENDLRITNATTIVSNLIIEDDSYFNYGQQRNHIAIEDNSGNWLPREIVNVIDLGSGKTQLTLDSAINLNPADIVRISFLGLNRLNADAVSFSWIGNNVVTSEVSILEIKPE